MTLLSNRGSPQLIVAGKGGAAANHRAERSSARRVRSEMRTAVASGGAVCARIICIVNVSASCLVSAYTAVLVHTTQL